MYRRAATCESDHYDPEGDLRTRYPDWTLHTGLPGAIGSNWVSFQNHLKMAVVNPDLSPEDRTFAVAFIVAVLDTGDLHEGMADIPQRVLEDAEDIADLRLGTSPLTDEEWLPDLPVDGEPTVAPGGWL